MNANLKLITLEFSEWNGDRLNWKVEKISLDDFNMLISDNAQGKTKFLNILKFLHNVHTGKIIFNNPNYRSTFILTFKDGEDTIVYSIQLNGVKTGQGLLFNEIVKRNETVLFDREKNILIEENTGKSIDKFLLASTTPVISTFNGSGYKTFNDLQYFFQRMLFLDANRFPPNIAFTDVGMGNKDSMILNSQSSNIGYVIANWKEKMPQVYNDVIKIFKECFSYITDIYLKEEPMGAFHVPVLFFKEKNVDHDVGQLEWSDGVYRSLSHFILGCTQYFQQDKDSIVRPSLIGVDEFENGLDYNTLRKVISHYESYSNLFQVLITTHSPIACNMIDPKHWIILRRKGSIVKSFRPEDVEDLESQRKKLKVDNWEFYRRHISTSGIYQIK